MHVRRTSVNSVIFFFFFFFSPSTKIPRMLGYLLEKIYIFICVCIYMIFNIQVLTVMSVYLQALLERTGYTLDVTTGQRKYGGPPPDSVYSGVQPGIGTEVSVLQPFAEIFPVCKYFYLLYDGKNNFHFFRRVAIAFVLLSICILLPL